MDFATVAVDENVSRNLVTFGRLHIGNDHPIPSVPRSNPGCANEMVHRHMFRKDEIEAYFDRICFPKSWRTYDVSALADDNKLSFLNLLQKHHLVKVPWENVAQHYSWHKLINVKQPYLHRKIVGNAGRGGYCMEVNYFYHHVLLSVGFDVYMAGSRIWKAPLRKYGGWTHVVNLVTIGGKKYLLDGGFGGPGPSRAVPLDHGVISRHIEPADMRVLCENTPNNVDRSQKVWVYQHRNDESSQWTPMYCFVELEFTPEDIESMNFEPSMNQHTFFTHKVVANRFTTDKEVGGPGGPGSPDEDALEGEIDGSITINHDVLKWRRHGKRVVEIPFKTEQDRIAALENYFGIILTQEEREAITNTAAQIGVRAMGVDD